MSHVYIVAVQGRGPVPDVKVFRTREDAWEVYQLLRYQDDPVYHIPGEYTVDTREPGVTYLFQQLEVTDYTATLECD